MDTRAGLNLTTHQPVDDKANSSFFTEYLPKIYDRRKAAGLDDLIERMAGRSRMTSTTPAPTPDNPTLP